MISVEHVGDGVIDRNFESIARRLIDTGGRVAALRWGTSTVHFAASQFSATVTVTHGLGRVPAVYGAWGNSGAGIDFGCSNPTLTTIDIRASYWPGAITQDAVCSWAVLG